MAWIKKNVMNILIWGTVLFFTGLYISLIFNHNIWTDEAFTLELIQGNLKEITAGTANDVHPPFYYYYAKLFYTFFGLNLQAQKIAAIIPMVLTLVIGATWVRKLFSDRASLLFLLMLTCMPCSMEFAVQVRMYSLALLFVTLCGIGAYLSYTRGKIADWILFAVSGALAAYTHYFAFVPVIIITGIFLLVLLFCNRKALKGWCLSAVAMILMYLPWMKSFYIQITRVRESYWIPEITPQTIWSYFIWTFDTDLVPGVVYGFLLILFGTGIYNICRIIRKRQKEDVYALLCMLIPTFTALGGIIISLSRSPIYRDQYIFPSIALLALFFGISMRNADKKILIPVCAFLLFVGAIQYKECFRQEYRSTYVPQTEAFFEENLTDEDYVVYNWEDFGFIYNFYFPHGQLRYLEDFDFSENFQTVWFINSQYQPQIDQALLDANGLSMELVGHYGIEHNEFDLYRIDRNEFTE